MKAVLSLLIAVFYSAIAFAQCDTTSIDNSGWSIHFTDSEHSSGPASNAIDGDSATIWHTEWELAQPDYPHEIQIDLGQSYPVNGIQYLPRQTGTINGKITEYEVYLGADGTNWGTPEASGEFTYANNNDNGSRSVYFGAVNAQYVRLVGNAAFNDNYFAVASEILVFQDVGCGATGQENQQISFDQIDDALSTDGPITLVASATSTLSVDFQVISGPASVSGNTLTLDGSSGIVVVEATQVGDATYYPASATRTFEVFDPADYQPVVSTRLTDDHELEMYQSEEYRIYINASIDLPDLLNISSVSMTIDGNAVEVLESGSGYFYYDWTPANFTTYAVEIVATGSNGETTTLTRNVQVSDQPTTQIVTTMDDVNITFGGINSRWFYGSYTMPQHVAAYDQILAYLNISCPGGDCDDWDRLAYIDIKAPDGNWIQIIRYITPYGVACEHAIDLTAYSSLLQGEVEFRMFIDTWGTGGWLIDLDLEYDSGAPEYKYSAVDEVWDGAYNFGNLDNLQPVETVDFPHYSNTASAHLRLSNTGHGWGDNNTSNAAEFYAATNFIDLNGSQTYTEFLWNTCNPNPDGCSPQSGTWTFNRAGWCPGAISPPAEYDLDPTIAAGSVQLDYRFDPNYTDFCHAANPNCITGATCPNCNDGYNPVYHVDGQVISYSNTPLYPADAPTDIENIDNILDYEMSVMPNPSTGLFQLIVPELDRNAAVFIRSIDGKTIKSYHFSSAQQLRTYTFDLRDQASGTYFISLENEAGTGAKKIVISQ